MLQKQRTSNANKIISNDDDLTQHEMQKFKDSRPSTPITSDGVINAAKVRLNQKRSLSRVSSSSENSLSSDRDIKLKITRSNSEQYSNGAAEAIDSIETTTPSPPAPTQPLTNVNDGNDNDNDNVNDEQKQHIEPVQCDTSAQPTEEITELKESLPQQANEQTTAEIVIVENSAETTDITETTDNTEDKQEIQQKQESQVENSPNEKIIEIDNDSNSMNVECSSEQNAVQNGEDEAADLKNPLDALIRAASILNPRQFELPRELAIFPQFPGDEKGELKIFHHFFSILQSKMCNNF